ncbi:MAG: hypothetical protein HY094_09990 [Candidatus Melainabacteria bacterium]|nr:hypothetical protein [Candidatus Melainabacteria bacterium]
MRINTIPPVDRVGQKASMQFIGLTERPKILLNQDRGDLTRHTESIMIASRVWGQGWKPLAVIEDYGTNDSWDFSKCDGDTVRILPAMLKSVGYTDEVTIQNN